MKERADAVANIKPSGARKFRTDIDALRKEELKRRRILRLEQVRQQSKDIASDIRRRVRVEKNCLTENFQKKSEVAVSQWKEQKLTALQNELTQTLSYVGTAHKQAECESKQEETKELLKNHHIEAADRRGREAILRLRSDELARRQVEEARKNHQQHVKSIEVARSAVVVSLPTPESTVPVRNIPHVPKTEVAKRDRSAESSSKQWPSKPWPVSIPLGVTPANVDDTDSNWTNNTAKSVVTRGSKDESNCLPPNQDSDTTSIPASSRQGIAVGDASVKASSSKLSAHGPRRNITASKTEKEPKEVELFDYTNGSHVQYIKSSAVSKSIPAGPVDGMEAAEACASISNLKPAASQMSSTKRIERGKEAIKRVQARREHQALLSELAGLVRQQAALRSFLPEPEEPKKIQKKLNEAVVDILKEAPDRNVVRRNIELKKTEPVPAKMAPISVASYPERDETIIDYCSIVSENSSKRPFKEDRTKDDENSKDTEAGGDFFQQERNLGTVPAEKASERKTEDGSFLACETSVGSDVPILNLALWTSHSPGSSDFEKKTLTPSDKGRSSKDLGDATLTPSEKVNESKSSKGSSVSPSASNGSTSQSVSEEKRSTRSDKYSIQKEKIPLKNDADQRQSEVRSTKQTARHLGSGDYVSGTNHRRPSPKQKSPEVRPKAAEADAEVNTPGEALSASEGVRKRSKKVSPSSSSTSYMSLPNKLLSAITEDLRSLLSLTRHRQNGDFPSHTNPLLAHYINRLLDMSRQSVDQLNVVTSEVPTPPSAIFRNGSYDSSRQSVSLPPASDSNGTERRSSDFVSSITDTTKTSVGSSSDNSELVSVMRQCHARISSLSQMIERVRQENVSTPVQMRSSPSLHLDSTAYLSPPSFLMPSPQMLPRNTEQPGRSMDDTYGAVITRLLSEIRQQLAKEAEKPLQINLTPPHGTAKNIKSSSSNELSTIPEQDSSFQEWSSVIIRSETNGSSEDVEKEFSRMGLGWAGTTLRKTKEAYTLDSNSSSDILELSALSLFGSYSHSTPIKSMEDKQGRT